MRELETRVLRFHCKIFQILKVIDLILGRKKILRHKIPLQDFNGVPGFIILMDLWEKELCLSMISLAVKIKARSLRTFILSKPKNNKEKGNNLCSFTSWPFSFSIKTRFTIAAHQGILQNIA